MKKLLAVLLAIVIVVGLVACSASETKSEKFLKEYSEWVDEYVVLLKKYKENPADLSLIADYTNMVAKASDWLAQAEEIKKEITNETEAANFASELLKISARIASEIG